MTLKTLFRPTKGRIALFLLLFFLIGAIDTNMRPFQNSPLLFKFWTTGAPEFLVYLLILPYLLSCIIPAALFRTKTQESKPSSLNHFFNPQQESVRQDKIKEMTEVKAAFKESQKTQEPPAQKPEAAKPAPKAKPSAKKAKPAKAKRPARKPKAKPRKAKKVR